MALYQSKQIKARTPVIAAGGAYDTIPIVGDFVIPAGLANGDIIEMGCLPFGYVPVDLIVSTPQIDSNGSATATLDAGMISGVYGDTVNARTIGSEFFAADTGCRAAAGALIRMNKATGAVIAPATQATVAGGGAADRGWGIKVSAAIATLATGGTLRATLIARPQYDAV